MMNKIQAKAPKYEYVPNNIMREKGLTPTAKFMFVEILNWEYRDGKFDLSNHQLAELLDSSIDSVTKAVGSLRKMKLVKATYLTGGYRLMNVDKKYLDELSKLKGEK